MPYPYITDDNLENPQGYDYTAFEGIAFFADYVQSRTNTLSHTQERAPNDEERIYQNAIPLLAECRDNRALLDLVIKTFEVNKRLYARYERVLSVRNNGEILKPNKHSSYTNPYNYGAFGLALIHAHQKSKDLITLNTLIKLNDLMLSKRNWGGAIIQTLQRCVRYEMQAITEILGVDMQTLTTAQLEKKYLDSLDSKMSLVGLDSSESNALRAYLLSGQRAQSAQGNRAMQALKSHTPGASAKVALESDVAMIYSHTPRSRIYLQTLLERGIAPSCVISLGEQEDIFLCEQIERFGIAHKNLATKDINDPQCLQLIASLPQKYVIYSGYGGGILCEAYFALEKKFIHIHAGKLPQYRGSTTCYYSLLQERNICASVMFLNAQLDEGKVLGEVSFSREDIRALGSIDIDTTIEPYIRAMALSEVMARYVQTREFESRAQSGAQSGMYYKIHPLLKHIAILECFGGV